MVGFFKLVSMFVWTGLLSVLYVVISMIFICSVKGLSLGSLSIFSSSVSEFSLCAVVQCSSWAKEPSVNNIRLQSCKNCLIIIFIFGDI